MRILVVGINYAPDLIGVAKYTTELCEALASFGHEVRVITAPPYYPAWKIPSSFRGLHYGHELINGVSVTRSPIYVPQNPTGPKRLLHHLSFAMTSAWPVAVSALRKSPDIVLSVAPSLMSAAFPAWIGRRTGALTWLHLQDFEVDAAFDLGLLSNRLLRKPMIAVEQRILKSFDHLSTISPQMAHRLTAKTSNSTIWELRNWTDTSQIANAGYSSQLRDELGLADSHFVALYAGTMSNKQGLELIVEAARTLSQSAPNVRFVLSGAGPERINLQQLAVGLRNIQFLDLQPDLRFAQLLKTADVHLIPQRAEAADLVLPSKLGGILASGKPVIVMAEPGTGLADEIESAGIRIAPGDSIALAATINWLAQHPSLCSTLGDGAKATALARWDKHTILKGLMDRLEMLSSTRGRRLDDEPGILPRKGPIRDGLSSNITK
ncbi:WcaI family glycosyltransferase [Bradyrhizobium sp. MOS002]|uniref:WcaI family glycosyltransferase n=1 Tax=Bradyrhizobium sp. MOS002 TaxID=2133947 RepID=UPI000D119D28|nr:WcaI family glycosyltransferase [Bradyrhizobium sp. MOS002]PSO25979.1 colanic acid biosynthesis glycosyltransferase WcaI [Bradyrhizobium sp. MOS002]